MGTFAFGATVVRYVAWLSVATTRSLGDGISDPDDEPDDAHDALLATMRRTITGRIIDPRRRRPMIRYAGPRALQETAAALAGDLTRRTGRVSRRREPAIEPVEGRRRTRDA